MGRFTPRTTEREMRSAWWDCMVGHKRLCQSEEVGVGGRLAHISTFLGSSRFRSSPWPNWPRLPSPQLQTAPSAVRARLCVCPNPAETATTRWPAKAATFVGCHWSCSSPWPSSSPQLQTAPSAVMARLWSLNADTATTRQPARRGPTCAPPWWHPNRASTRGGVRGGISVDG